MKKLTAILALGAILYSCTENEKPDQLNLEKSNSISSASGFEGKDVIQIPSQAPKGSAENAMILASFTPIDDVSGNYTTETTLLDISGIPCYTLLNSVTDGVITLNFDKDMDKRQADVCGWYNEGWGTPPNVEGPNPHILFSGGQNSLGISLSAPVNTFGFELQPNIIGIPYDFQVAFYSGASLIGTVTRSVSTTGGARLFAAETDADFDNILITVTGNPLGFSIGQFRYAFEDENPFTVDVKPDTCENPVNVNSNGVIPVGILASMDLDVNDIDLSTVRLNGVAPKMSSISDLGGFYEKEEACDCDPTDFDGIMDLDLKFDTQAIVTTLGAVTDGQNVTVALTFDTMDGKSWTGEDCIWVIKKGKK
jgi:hypothetical protein